MRHHFHYYSISAAVELTATTASSGGRSTVPRDVVRYAVHVVLGFGPLHAVARVLDFVHPVRAGLVVSQDDLHPGGQGHRRRRRATTDGSVVVVVTTSCGTVATVAVVPWVVGIGRGRRRAVVKIRIVMRLPRGVTMRHRAPIGRML